ncbi:hypothetical protein OC845_001277 [Tilletia horrida]|nr:hypothetical protein OC845_001277 [Tilletia horrida]
MSAYQPLEHPDQARSSSASSSSFHHQQQHLRDSDQQSFRSISAQVRPPAPAIKFKSQDLRDALALHDAHTRKVYMEGYLSRRDELTPQGKPLHPSDERSRWSLCFLQLCGTVLSVWSVAEMTKAAAEGREVPPSYIDITDAFVDYLGVLVEDVPMPPPQPIRRVQHDNVFTLNSAGQNRIHFCVEGAVGRRLVQAWINAIRLASWEKMRLEEVYTGALLRTRLSAIAAQQAAAQGLAPPGPDGIILGPDGTPLPPLKLVTPLVKGKMEGYIKARFMGTTEWQSCYLVLQERRAAHEDESMLANAVAGASNASSSTPGQASIDASFGSPNASSSGGGEKKRFWQKLPGTGSNRDSILSFGGGGGGSNEPGSPLGPGGFGTGFAFTNDPSMADPAALEPPPGHNGAAGLAMFYENKKSKKPFATMMHVSAVFAVYPSRPELVEGSSLFKVEGAFPGSNILSATHHARQTGFVLILPEVDSSGSTPSSPPLGAAGSAVLGANTKMMNWAIGFMDVFRLYGRPRALSWDPRDPASFFFAYPIGNFRDRLFLDRELAEFLDIREERHAAQRTNLSMVIRKRMQGERTPVLPPLPVPNRESTALLERRASRLVSGGVSKVGAQPNVGPTPPVMAGQNGSTPTNGNGASAPTPVAKPPRPDSDEEDTEDEPEDDDDDDEEPLSRKQSAPLPPRLTVTNGPADSPPAIAPTRVVASDTASSSSTPQVTPREATAIPSEYTPSRLGQTNVTAGGATTTAAQAAQSSALTPAETQQNIAQLRRLSEVDPGLGPEFAALLNFDGGFDDFGGGNPTTGGAAATAAAVGLGAAAPLAEKKAAIHGHGAANAAANAYGAPPGVPPTAPLNVRTSTSSTAWSSSAASAQPEGGLPPLVPPKTESSAASGAYGPSPASTTRQSPYTSTSPSSYSGTSGGVGASAGSLGSTVVRPTAVLATPAPIPEASPALPIVPEDRPLETKSKSMVPDAEAAVPKAQQQGQRGSTGAYDESTLFFMSSMSDQLPAGQPAAVTPSAQAQPTSPQAVSSAREDKLQQLSPTPADRPNNSGQEDASIGDDALAAYSYLEKPPSPALQNGGAFANAAADMSRDSSTSAASHPPRPLPPTTTFSQANKRAMERKTAAQLQAQAHQEALKTPGGAGGATAGGSGSKKKKVVDMGRARKRGTGAWVGDTSSDDDEDEEEEEEEDDDDDEKGNNEPILSRSQAQLRQGQQQVSTPPTVPGSAGGIPPRARVGSGPQAANMGNMEELQRAAAQAGLQAPAPGRFSSYEGFAPGAGPSGMRAPSPAAAAGATSGGYRTASPSAVGSAGWQSSGRNSPFGVGATGSGRNSPRMGGSPAAGPVHVVGPGSAAMMLQAATGGRAGTPPAHAGAGGPGGLRNSNNPRMSVFNSHLGAQHDGAAVSGGGGGQYTPGLAERDASGEHLATPPTFVQLKEEEQPGAMTALFQPSGLLQAGAQDKAERSAKAREEDARAAGGHLVSVPNKPPPPQAGLLGAITAHERDRKGAGGIGATLTERERERVTVERRQREEEQAAAMGMYQRNSMMMGMGMPMGPPMGMYPNPYMWQQMMMQQQQQQQMMMAAAHQQRAGSPGGWGGSQVGGAGSPPGASSPGRAGTPSGPAGGGHSQMGSGASGYVDPMAAQQAAMQAAHQAYMQAMSQMGGGGAGAGPGSDMNRMSMMSMGMPPPGTMGMGGGYMPAPMSMMGFPPFAGGPGSMMMGHGGGMTPNSEYGAGTAGGPLVGAGFGGGAGAMPSPASMAAAARQRTKSGSPGTGGQAQR